ncbi:hypothetical protein SCALM49S_03413 [Streptomyces californicus]
MGEELPGLVVAARIGEHRVLVQVLGQSAGVLEELADRDGPPVDAVAAQQSGRYASTGSSRAMPPSPANWSTTVAVNALVLLPMRTEPSRGTAAPVARLPMPEV